MPILEFLSKWGQLIVQNPTAFVVFAGIVGTVTWKLCQITYSAQISALRERLSLAEDKAKHSHDGKASTQPAPKGEELALVISEPSSVNYKSKPNIIFSHCKMDSILIGEDTPVGIWVAEFVNAVSSKRDEVHGVVAHLEYFAEGSGIWKTNQGLWLPGESRDFDFSMNEPGCVVLAAIIKEDFTKPHTVCAVGYRQVDELHPFNMDAYDIENKLPVIVKLKLLGDGIDMGFRFRIEKRDDVYLCSFVM